MLYALFAILCSYLLGSVSFGVLIGKYLCRKDPRESGSNSTGATNVARVCGFQYGVLTLLGDASKGILPMIWALSAEFSALTITLMALAALLGHLYSVFLHFTGGKAVATTIGIFLVLAPCPFMLCLAACVFVILTTGYVSLGSFTLATALPLVLFISGYWSYVPLALAVMVLVYWSHRANISRIVRGEEKSWQKKKYEEAA